MLPQRLSMFVRCGVGCSHYGGHPPLEDRTFSSILLVIRGNVHNPFAFVQGAGGGEVLTSAKGMVAIGSGEVGVGMV